MIQCFCWMYWLWTKTRCSLLVKLPDGCENLLTWWDNILKTTYSWIITNIWNKVNYLDVIHFKIICFFGRGDNEQNLEAAAGSSPCHQRQVWRPHNRLNIALDRSQMHNAIQIQFWSIKVEAKLNQGSQFNQGCI